MAGKIKRAEDNGAEGRRLIRLKLLSLLGENLHDRYMRELLNQGGNTDPLPKGAVKLLSSRIKWDANEISRVARGVYHITPGISARLTVTVGGA